MKTNQITFKVAKLDDSTAKAVGIAVSTDGAVAKELGMSRDQLSALGFDGKVGQTLLLPTSKTKLTSLTRSSLKPKKGKGGEATSAKSSD